MFPLTVFALYYKNQDRRGLRPLLMYIPGGLMMCNYVVLTSIKEHTESQAYLFDSVRLYNLTFNLQVLGIIVTVVTNLWNASVDKTVMNWLKKHHWLEREEHSTWGHFKSMCCCCFGGSSTLASADSAQEEIRTSAQVEMYPPDRSTGGTFSARQTKNPMKSNKADE